VVKNQLHLSLKFHIKIFCNQNELKLSKFVCTWKILKSLQHSPKYKIVKVRWCDNFPNFVLETRFVFWHIFVYWLWIDCIFQTNLIIFFFRKRFQFSIRDKNSNTIRDVWNWKLSQTAFKLQLSIAFSLKS